MVTTYGSAKQIHEPTLALLQARVSSPKFKDYAAWQVATFLHNFDYVH